MLILLRHSKTIGNQMGILQGRSETKLLEDKKFEIYKLKIITFLKKLTINSFYSSSSIRAQICSKLICEELKQSYLIDDKLLELDFGIYNGLFINKIDKKIWENREKDKINFKWEGGESFKDVIIRTNKFLLENNLYKKQKSNENFVILSHESVNRSIIYNFKKNSKVLSKKQKNDQIITIDNGEVNYLK